MFKSYWYIGNLNESEPKGREELWHFRHYTLPLLGVLHRRALPRTIITAPYPARIETNDELLPLQYLWDLLRIFHGRRVRVVHQNPRLV